MNSGMTEEQKAEMKKLQNILDIFIKNGVHCNIHLDVPTETLVFDAKEFDVPYKDELVAAGATYDIGKGCWTFFTDV